MSIPSAWGCPNSLHYKLLGHGRARIQHNPAKYLGYHLRKGQKASAESANVHIISIFHTGDWLYDSTLGQDGNVRYQKTT